MQAGVTGIAMFSQLLNIFKTPEVVYNKLHVDEHHLFSNLLSNHDFMEQVYSQNMSSLVGLNRLKSFNLTELLANLFYFFDAPNPVEGQYRLQKLVYGLLYRDDHLEELTPVMKWVTSAVIDVVAEKYY